MLRYLLLSLLFLSLLACGPVDQDNDGYNTLNDFDPLFDCNDNDKFVHPGAPELCNDGVDNNCNGTVDEDNASDAPTWYRDTDGDGYGDSGHFIPACTKPEGYVDNFTDCDDSNNFVHPGAEEVCDGVDNNCRRGIDDEDCSPPAGEVIQF